MHYNGEPQMVSRYEASSPASDRAWATLFRWNGLMPKTAWRAIVVREAR